MSNRGGSRTGAGRKSKAIEQKTSTICREALNAIYGNDIEVIKSMLLTGEVSLIKFVLEHAFGKPMDKVQSTNIEVQKAPPQLIHFSNGTTLDLS